MRLTRFEQKMMKKRISQLRDYMTKSLEKNDLHNYFNTLNSRELMMLENKMQTYSSSLSSASWSQ